MSCEVCGSDDACEIGIAKKYTGEQPLHVCKDCGFVFVKDRRPAAEIAADWDSQPGDDVYAASLASVEARHAYVARFAEPYLKNRVIDIGAGAGLFLRRLQQNGNFSPLMGISPAWGECQKMMEAGIQCFRGLAEDYHGDSFPTATLIWTLENTGSCKKTIQAARDMVENGGHVVVATGSRILVPFKKPLDRYLGPVTTDLHPWRFSKNTLSGLMAENGLKPVLVNRYIDTDYLVIVGQKTKNTGKWQRDDYRDVLKFFRDWHDVTHRFA